MGTMKMHQTSAFGELLRRHRLAAGLTQGDLAKRAGLSTRAVSDLERGVKSRPHPHTVHLLAAALGLEGPARAALQVARGQAAHADGGLPRGGSPMPGGNGRSTPLVGRDEELALLERHLVGEGFQG
jgi:transcriptional regulator with XRE-family HTH domain